MLTTLSYLQKHDIMILCFRYITNAPVNSIPPAFPTFKL